MGLFDFFRKKKDVRRMSIFDNELYPYSVADFDNHRKLFATLTFEQKCSLVYPIGCFYKTFMIEGTWQFEESADLCSQRENLLGISFDEAGEALRNHDGLLEALMSIEDKQIIDILLQDMKYLFRILVNMNLVLANGAENNQLAIQSLYSLFLPLGYDAKQVCDRREFTMF